MAEPDVIHHPDTADPVEGLRLDAWRSLDLAALARFDEFSGVRLHHIELGAAGPTLLFVHGIGNSLNMWLPTAAEMAADHRCLLVDLPGFGKSAGEFADTHIDRVTEVIADFVKRRCPDGPPVIVGHSMGALVSAHMAAMAASSLAAAVNVAGPPLAAIKLLDEPVHALRNHASQAVAMGKAMAAGLVPGGDKLIPRLVQSAKWRRRLFGSFVYRLNQVDADLAELLFTDLGNGRTIGAARNGRDYDAAAIYAKTAVPVTMIVGTEDPISTVDDGMRYIELAGRGTLHVLAATGHLPMVERPRLVESLIRDAAAGR